MTTFIILFLISTIIVLCFIGGSLLDILSCLKRIEHNSDKIRHDLFILTDETLNRREV
jgi:hypothetical protein